MRRFIASDPGFDAAFDAFLSERRGSPADVDAAVAEILEAVRSEGLAAVLRFAKTFDKVELTEETIRVSEAEIDAGVAACQPEVRSAGAGPRWRRWGSMSQAAARPIRQRC